MGNKKVRERGSGSGTPTHVRQDTDQHRADTNRGGRGGEGDPLMYCRTPSSTVPTQSTPPHTNCNLTADSWDIVMHASPPRPPAAGLGSLIFHKGIR